MSRVLLMMITSATTFFKPFFFEAALSVNLTTMLVMTTIFISKMEGLPPTSNIKMIDIWLVLCQMVPFAEVVLLTAMEYKREDKKPGKKSKKKTKKKTKKQKRCKQCWEQTIDRRKKETSTETQWSKKICQKSWSPSLKIIGRLAFSYF